MELEVFHHYIEVWAGDCAEVYQGSLSIPHDT